MISVRQNPHVLCLKFFNLDVLIEADTPQVIEIFDRLYSRFVNHDPVPSISLSFQIYTRPDNPYGQPVVLHSDEVWRIENPEHLEGMIYEFVYHHILRQVNSHILIHAGALSHHGCGLVLSADSMHGKTTLTLELIQRGFKFLSDEIAAIGREDGRVYPFPRSLRIRHDSLERVGLGAAAGRAKLWTDKLILDIDEIQPGTLGEAAPLKWIVILSSQGEFSDGLMIKPLRRYFVVVDKVEESFLAVIQRINDLQDLQVAHYPEKNCTGLTFRTRSYQAVIAKIDHTCQAGGIHILGYLKNLDSQPSFEQPAGLVRIPHSQAVMALIQRFLGGSQSTLFNGRLSRNARHLFVELAGVTRLARCYRLSVGPLIDMAELVKNLVESD